MDDERQIERKLKLVHIITLGLAYMAPFAVFDTFGIASNISSGHVPFAYVFVFLAILLTALSYGKLVKKYPSSGSVYAYTRNIINPYVGILVGWLSFIAYLSLPMINSLLAKIFISSLLPQIPGWTWIVGLVILITLLNIFGIEFAAALNIGLVFVQILVGIVFITLTIHDINNGPGHFMSFSELMPKFQELSGFFGASALLGMSFIGFDAVTTLAEDTVNPKKTIPKAIFFITIIGGVFFFTVTYFMQSLIPNVSILKNIQGASPEIATIIGGKAYLIFFILGGMLSVFASGLAAQISASRLLYAMGRDSVIPKKCFGYLNKKTKTPIFNIIITGILALSALFLNLQQATSLVNVGAYTAFLVVNICVVKNYFTLDNKSNIYRIITELCFPGIGLIFILYLWFNLDKFAIVMGVIWFIIGVIYLLTTTRCFTKEPVDITFEELED